MKIKYYVVPVNGNDGFDAAYAIATHQRVSVEDVVILSPDDLSQVFKVPYLQGYKGLALLVKSCEYLGKNIDVESMISKDNTMVFNLDKNVFIINCESPLIINAFSPRVVESVNLSQYLSFERIGNPSDWIVDNTICSYFTCAISHDLVDNTETAQVVTSENSDVIELTFDDIIELSSDKDTDIFEG